MPKPRNFEVTCPRCGETWNLSPWKWRNFNSVLKTGKKKVHCPFCNKLIILSKEMTRTLMEAWVKAKKEKSEVGKIRPVHFRH